MTAWQETLQIVIEARSRVHTAQEAQDIGALGKAEGALERGLARLFAVAEAYPELRSNENFTKLQQRISMLENGLADRREIYNDAVNINNTDATSYFRTSIRIVWPAVTCCGHYFTSPLSWRRSERFAGY